MIDEKKLIDDGGKCIECPYKYPIQRKFGVTWHCSKEITQMDVTFHTKAMNNNPLCPIKQGGGINEVSYNDRNGERSR